MNIEYENEYEVDVARNRNADKIFIGTESRCTIYIAHAVAHLSRARASANTISKREILQYLTRPYLRVFVSCYLLPAVCVYVVVFCFEVRPRIMFH